MIREEKVTKGKVLVELAHYGAKAKAFRESIDLIVRKMDLITDKDSKEYSELSEVANLIWAMRDAAEKTESEANEKLDEILEQEKRHYHKPASRMITPKHRYLVKYLTRI